MDNHPDLSFDIDALFDHMINNLEHELSDEKEWEFSFRAEDISKLQQVATRLEDEFDTRLQEEVEEVSHDGHVSIGPPLLIVLRRGALTPDDVKSIASRLASLAEDEDITYEGVSCFDVIDEEELFGWLDLDGAAWRLRHFTDCGLEFDAKLPWAFLLLANNTQDLQAAEVAVRQAGHERTECFEEPDEEGQFGMCVFIDGKNNEAELAKTHEKLVELIQPHNAQVAGIQFFLEEDFE